MALHQSLNPLLFPLNHPGSSTVDLCPLVSMTGASGAVCVILGAGVPMHGPDILGCSTDSVWLRLLWSSLSN